MIEESLMTDVTDTDTRMTARDHMARVGSLLLQAFADFVMPDRYWGCRCSACTEARCRANSFWLGVISERLSVLHSRAEDNLAWAAERGWSNSLRAELGRQQRGIDAYLEAINQFLGEHQLNRIIQPLPFWQGVLCERYIMLAEGRLSAADKRRMGLRWCTSEENIAHMMIDLMHGVGRIGPNGFAWMREQLHQRGDDKMYDLQRSRDILRAACHLMESTS